MAMDLPTPATRNDPPGRRPLSARLRFLVVGFAGAATLTCRFSPGGRVRGAGIVSPHHCVNCNQSLMWHEIAASIADVEFAEAMRASGDTAGKEGSNVTSDR
jgi:hypothetical protein